MEPSYVYVVRTGIPYEGYTEERYYGKFSKALADVRERIDHLSRDVPNFEDREKLWTCRENLWTWEEESMEIWFEVKKEEIL